MKLKKKNTTWYNTRDKELNGMLRESRRTVARRGGLGPDSRLGTRLMWVGPEFQSTIL